MKTTDPLEISSSTTVLTAVDGSVTEIDSLIVMNNSTDLASISIYIAPDGDSVSETLNRVAFKMLEAKTSRRFLEGVRLSPLSRLVISADENGVVAVLGYTEYSEESQESDGGILSGGGL